MNEPVGILYVYGNPVDRELVRDALEKGGGDFRLIEAGSRDEFETMLAEEDIGLILTDTNISGFEDLQIMDAIRTEHPGVPVVIVTVIESEETAVEALKRGAADYVLKSPGHIRRLPHAIQAAIDRKRIEDDRKRAEDALRQAHDELERKVEERTRELRTINEKLQLELGVLIRAEEELRRAAHQLELQANERSEELKTKSEQLSLEIAERKRTAEALNGSEKRCRLLVENASDVIWTLDLNLRYTYVSPSVTQLLGYTVQEIMKFNPVDTLTPSSRERVVRTFYEELSLEKSGRRGNYTARFEDIEQYRKDGSTVWLEITTTFLRDKEGRPVEILGISHDITHRKRAEDAFREARDELELRVEERTKELVATNKRLEREITEHKRTETALRESEEKYRLVVDNATEIIFVAQEGRIIFANSEAIRRSGYSLEELRSTSFLEFVHPDDRGLVAERGQQRLRGEEVPGAYPIRVIDRYNNTSWAYFNIVPITWQGKPATLAFGTDVTDLKQKEQALRESEARYRTLFEQSMDAIVIVRSEGEIVDANLACSELLGAGIEELKGADIRQFYWNPADRDIFREHLDRDGFVKEFEWKARRKDGSERNCLVTASAWRDTDGTILGYLSFLRDVTERRRLQMQLAQAQKMEAIGTLAGGIAHDFNNILFVIMGYTELTLDEVAGGTSLHSNLEAVLRSGKRARDLVTQILTFSRQGQQEEKPILINPILKESIKFLRASIPTTIEIRENIIQDSGMILGDPTQIYQVIMNLCTNAAHAMSERGGILELGLKDVELDSAIAGQYAEIAPGSYLKLSVSDTGHGIPPAILERIFEPYFTTKEKGEGTGLGLSVVHGIVKSHGGMIRVYSEPGKGSTFQVHLPMLQERQNKEHHVSEIVPGGHERILFVDDEQAVVEMGQQMLEHLGYDVTTRTSSLEALELFRARPDQFELVITDMTMPNMTGADLTKEIRNIRRDVPVILCTGFSQLISEESARNFRIDAVLTT